MRAGVILALLVFSGCGAAARAPKQHVAAVPSTTENPLSNAAPETMPIAAPDAPDKPPVESSLPTAEAAVSPIVSAPADSRGIKRAELRGRVENHAGQRLTIEPLMILSPTYPVPATTAGLWIEGKGDGGEADWLLFAEVKVAHSLHFGMPMVVDIVKKEALGAQRRALETLPRGSRVRIEWAW
ncbi:MAG: hypothetical protein IPM54_33255 [Polyangiaceae bacterium]|nr:hypothetical protein [Polyangiaceae bacterium]